MIKKLIEVVLIACFGFSYVSISQENMAKENRVCIDPGHGGMDGGCEFNGLCEKDINLKICFFLLEELERMGFIVEMTRLGDYDLASKNAKIRKAEDMENRCKIINKNIVFISVHTNKFSDPKVNGPQVFYLDKYDNKKLAESIQNYMNNSFSSKRTVLETKDKYLLNNTNITGCLVEVGFISNPKENKLLQDTKYQEKIAKSIAYGFLDYINS